MSLLSGILIGLAPAITATRRNLKPAFQEGGRGVSGGAAARRIRRVLVVARIRARDRAARRRRSADPQPAERPERRSWIQDGTRDVDATRQPSVSERRASIDYFNRVLEQARAVGGVESAAITSEFFIGGNPEQTVTVEGSTRAVSERVRLRRDEISRRFFRHLGTPLIRGRDFSPADDANAPRVAIINEAMERRLWPGQDAVGRRFKFGPRDSDGDWFTVVGSCATCAARVWNTTPSRRCSSRSRRIRRASSRCWYERRPILEA